MNAFVSWLKEAGASFSLKYVNPNKFLIVVFFHWKKKRLLFV